MMWPTIRATLGALLVSLTGLAFVPFPAAATEACLRATTTGGTAGGVSLNNEVSVSSDGSVEPNKAQKDCALYLCSMTFKDGRLLDDSASKGCRDVWIDPDGNGVTVKAAFQPASSSASTSAMNFMLTVKVQDSGIWKTPDCVWQLGQNNQVAGAQILMNECPYPGSSGQWYFFTSITNISPGLYGELELYYGEDVAPA